MGEYTLFHELCTEVRKKYFKELFDIVEGDGLTRCHTLELDDKDEQCSKEELEKERQSLKKILGEKMTSKWNVIDLKSDLLEVMEKHKITNHFTFEPRQLPKFDEVFKQWNEAQKDDNKFAHELWNKDKLKHFNSMFMQGQVRIFYIE